MRLASRLAAALVVTCAAVDAHAIPLLTGFGGPTGYGTNQLFLNDDQSSTAIDLTAAFPGGLLYFGSTYSTFYVNNNGNITFSGPLGTYTPSAFPIASQPMIAPFWGDVDTRAGGDPAQNGVWWYVERGRVIVTWDHVGYYSEHNDRMNSFQLVLSEDPACPGPGNFDVEFRYARCEWTTGDASGGSGGFGGTPAQAGFDAGNLRDYYAIPGSQTMSILDVCTMSNGGTAGDWLFTICDGVITGGCPGAGAPCTVPGQRGLCARGVNHCAGNGGTVCAQIVMPMADVCDGQDNDCNGAVDDGIAPRACYDGPGGTENVGVCHGGASSCTGGMFGACAGEVLPSTEVCDALDNDCNGIVDDLPPLSCYSGPPGTAGVGVCAAGGRQCSGGSWLACDGEVLPSMEICDGYDNDCDGTVDDGLIDCHAEPVPDVATDARDATDISVPPRDGAPTSCGADPRCDRMLRIEGRAGPLGCQCRAVPVRSGAGRLALFAMAVVFAASRRRRRGGA